MSEGNHWYMYIKTWKVETYSLDFIKKTIKIKEFSDIHMDGRNSLVLRLRLFFRDQFMRTTVICVNFCGGNDCCVLLKS